MSREAGKAVKIGRGPATVIGFAFTGERPKARLPFLRQEAKLFARKRIAASPTGLVGLFRFRKQGSSEAKK